MIPLCRLCLQRTEKAISLDLIGLENIQEWAIKFIGLEINFASGYSTAICWPCFCTVRNWAEFLKAQAAKCEFNELACFPSWWNDVDKDEIVKQSRQLAETKSVIKKEISSEPVCFSPNKEYHPKIEAIHSTTEVKICSVDLKKLDQTFIKKCTQGLVKLGTEQQDCDDAAPSSNGFTCEECHLVFSASSSLKLHTEQIHPDVKSCPNCHLTFAWKRSLTKHVLEKTCLISREENQKVYFCPKCPNTFDDFSHLTGHAKSKHNECSLPKEHFPCPRCCHIYLLKSQLADHYKISHGSYCSACSTSFPSKLDLVAHTAEIHPNVKFQNYFERLDAKTVICIFCEMKFGCREEVAYHIPKFHKHWNYLLLKPIDPSALNMATMSSIEISDPMTAEGTEKISRNTGKGASFMNTAEEHETNGVPVTIFEKAMPAHKETESNSLHSRAQVFCCNQCNWACQSLKQLGNHIQAKHRELLPYRCPGCGIGDFCSNRSRNHSMKCSKVTKATKQVFRTCSSYKKHPVVCPLCELKLGNAHRFPRHFIKQHSSSLCFMCPGCKDRQMSTRQLVFHMRSCKKVNIVIPTLGSGYEARSNGDQLPRETNLFKCKFCTRKYVFQSWLNNHMRTHLANLKESMFTCDLCPRQFSQFKELEIHKKTHREPAKHQKEMTATRPTSSSLVRKLYRCKYCPKVFTDYSKLGGHSRQYHRNRSKTGHKQLNPGLSAQMININETHRDHVLTCDLCPRLFTQSKELEIHKKTHREPAKHHKEKTTTRPTSSSLVRKLYRCKYCPKVFTDYSKLGGHSRQYHRNRSKTGQKQLNPGLSAQMININETHRNHVFTCDLCPRLFSQSTELEIHKKTHSKPAESQTLNKPTSSSAGKKLHRCKYCPMVFKDRFTLGGHSKNNHRNQSMNGHKHQNSGSHVKIINNETSRKPVFSCDLCPCLFTLSEELQKHKKTHSKPDDQQKEMTVAKLTPSSVGRKLGGYFKHHMKNQSNQQAIGICKKPAMPNQTQITHRISDKGALILTVKVKWFVCRVCRKVLRTDDEFTSHIMEHSNCTTCAGCKETFANLYSIRKHLFDCKKLSSAERELFLLTIHPIVQETGWFCEVCKAMLSSASEVADHLRKAHSIEQGLGLINLESKLGDAQTKGSEVHNVPAKPKEQSAMAKKMAATVLEVEEVAVQEKEVPKVPAKRKSELDCVTIQKIKPKVPEVLKVSWDEPCNKFSINCPACKRCVLQVEKLAEVGESVEKCRLDHSCKGFACVLCGSKFYMKSEFKEHMEVHKKAQGSSKLGTGKTTSQEDKQKIGEKDRIISLVVLD